jgi:hypothetical protein
LQSTLALSKGEQAGLTSFDFGLNELEGAPLQLFLLLARTNPRASRANSRIDSSGGAIVRGTLGSTIKCGSKVLCSVYSEKQRRAHF